MSTAVELAEQPGIDDAEAHNDNRPAMEIASGLIGSIPPQRLERAVRLLARRIVDLALREMEETTGGNH